MENAVEQGRAASGAVSGKARRRRGAFLFAAGLAASVALTGCAGSPRNPPSDPLLGGRSTPPGSIAGGPGTPPPVPSASTPFAPSVPSSTAALASGPARPLDTGMRIGGEPSPIPDYHAPPSPGWSQPVLQNPEPAAGSMARSGPSPITPAHAGPGSYEQAQEVLRGRGVTWQRLETWGDKGEWKFTCSIPNKQNPAIARNYEARANAPIDAIHAVLEKLDKEP